MSSLRKKKFIMYKALPPAPYATEDKEFKYLAEFLRTGDWLHAGKRYWPEKTETQLVPFLGTRKAQETMKFIADMRDRGLILSDNALENALGAIAFGDIAEMFEADGVSLKNMHDIPLMVRYAIKSFKVHDGLDGRIYDVQMYDRIKSIETLMRKYNSFAEDNKAKATKFVISLSDGRGIENG